MAVRVFLGLLRLRTFRAWQQRVRDSRALVEGAMQKAAVRQVRGAHAAVTTLQRYARRQRLN
eukprot:3837085-Pleurochrysis_carterae.AAC.1